MAEQPNFVPSSTSSDNINHSTERKELHQQTETTSSTTHLLERNVKQIQIKEESTTKKILKTREIKHYNTSGEQISMNAKNSNSVLDTTNEAFVDHEQAQVDEENQYRPVQDQDNFQTQSNIVVSDRMDGTDAVDHHIHREIEVTPENIMTKHASNNHQQNFSMTNSANMSELLSNQNDIQQSNQLYAPAPQGTIRGNPVSVPQSGYEELDSTLSYMNQHHQSKFLVGDPDASIYGNKVLFHVQPQQLVQHDPMAQNGTYVTRGSNYEVAYDMTGAVAQMPITSSAGIYETRPVQEPLYAINRDGNLTYVTQPIINGGSEIQWRDPDLEEVISFMNSPNSVIRANSVAYLQHLSFADDHIKQRTRLLGGIPILVELLNRDILEVQRNVCGALRNLSYGRKNDDNKRAIRDAMGIQALVRTLVNNPDNEIRELATSVLWNLSSCEDIKWAIIDEALASIVSVIIVPYTAWFKANLNCSQQFIPTANETHWSTVFRNATGIIRNISSAGAPARKQLRDCDGLIESFFFIINVSINRNDVENKLVENCVCILRNLSYRCQETQDPDYDKHYYTNNSQLDSGTNSMQNSPSSPSSTANLTTSLAGQVSSKVSENLGCFSFARRSKSKSKSKSSLSTSKTSSNPNQADRSGTVKSESRSLLPPHHSSNLQANTSTPTLVRTSTQLDGFSNSNVTLPRSGISSIASPSSMSPSGKELLWQPDVVKPYLALLSGCSNSETLEAAAGAIQNLAACYWQPSIDIRAAVRKERGLPVLVELLRMDRDRVVCVVATALRNLAIDQKNKELIGKYAMPDLVNKLSGGQADQNSQTSDDTVAAVLATLHEVISNNADFVRSLYESGGLNKLNFIVRNGSKYSSRVQRFAAQVLLDMWKFTELREIYRKGGWKESHFILRPQLTSKASTYSVNSNTIERPMASQQADRSSSTRNLRVIGGTTMPQNVVHVNVSNSISNPNHPSYGSVQMTSLNGQVSNPQALYAQVDRHRRRGDANQQQSVMVNNC